MVSVLVVDDDAAVRSATTILLNANGFDVVAVADGPAGIEMAKNRHFDVAIVDLFMQGMDGLETTKAIRRYNANIPIIAASGFMLNGPTPEMPEFEAMAREAGATATMYKPFRPKVMLQIIQDALKA
jgi:two-component system, OmpR family, response regulator MtrA